MSQEWSTEATNLLPRRYKLVQLQIKCLQQEYKINKVKKRDGVVEKQKLLFEIELLKKK